MDDYPKRDSHFAHKAARLLFKSCATQAIGHHAALLVLHIVHTEDAARYKGPVTFWNSQLMETLGFTSPKQLNSARKIAVDAGWLRYERDGTRAVGNYYVTIPDSVTGFDDKPIEESRRIHSPGGTNNGTNQGQILSLLGTNPGTNPGTNCGTNCGKLPIPSPIPDPKYTHTHAVGDSWQASVTIPFGWSAELTLAAMAKWRTFRAGEDGRPPQAMQLEEMGRDAASSGWDDIRFSKSIDLAIARGAKHPIDPHNNHANKQRNGRSSEQPQQPKPAPKVGDVTGFSAPLPSPEIQRQIDLCEAAKAKALAEGKTPEEAREVARQLARELARAERKAIA